jgi:cell division protein FtsI/penicillin-binding protein 2
MFPRENPKYVVVILKENGESGSVDCAPIFKDISQLITSYE